MVSSCADKSRWNLSQAVPNDRPATAAASSFVVAATPFSTSTVSGGAVLDATGAAGLTNSSCITAYISNQPFTDGTRNWLLPRNLEQLSSKPFSSASAMCSRSRSMKLLRAAVDDSVDGDSDASKSIKPLLPLSVFSYKCSGLAKP